MQVSTSQRMGDNQSVTGTVKPAMVDSYNSLRPSRSVRLDSQTCMRFRAENDHELAGVIDYRVVLGQARLLRDLAQGSKGQWAFPHLP